MAPDSLIEAMGLATRRPENARTVASLMRAIDRFRRPRPESVLTPEELTAIRVPTTFILGSDDPYLSPGDARPSIASIPDAALHEMRAGHGPWLVDPERVAGLIAATPPRASLHPSAVGGHHMVG
jgi:pimeloyl-ACP methyl ester carboxylesterase